METKECSKCKKEKEISNFAHLQNWCRHCFSEYSKTPEQKMKMKAYIQNLPPWRKTYSAIRVRCNYGRYGKNGRSSYGEGRKMLITPDELKLLWFRDKGYLLKQPSIDRIDNNGDYTKENCRYIELLENISIGHLGRKQSASANQKRRLTMIAYWEKRKQNRQRRG